CFFFFSSRRRHTRSYGDWSSDVCSSDLRSLAALALRGVSKHGALRRSHASRRALTRPPPDEGERPLTDIRRSDILPPGGRGTDESRSLETARGHHAARRRGGATRRIDTSAW